ncbi:hypothetical protein FACS1894113_4630 [Alphaproteobacteria bacterium]|nr:hypothetical protein FACS1894113_4630 [Alphaproteobacteria bacterium]
MVVTVSDLKLFVPERKKTLGRRNDRVAAQLKSCLATELVRDDFPVVHGRENSSKLPCLVTITFIELSSDLRNADIYFMPLGGLLIKETEQFFETQTHYFKDVIAKKMRLKFIPNLRFKLDKSFEYSKKIDLLLQQQ